MVYPKRHAPFRVQAGTGGFGKQQKDAVGLPVGWVGLGWLEVS